MFLLIEIIDHVVREQINLEGVKKNKLYYE